QVAGCAQVSAQRPSAGLSSGPVLPKFQGWGRTAVRIRESDPMAMPATQIRKGNVIVFNGDPCRVVDFHHHTPGNLRAFMQVKMRNLRSGNMFEHRFRAADTVERAQMETHDLQYLYN